MVSRKRQRHSSSGTAVVEIVRELEHGRDIPVDELSREHIRSYFDTLKHLPAAFADRGSLRAKAGFSLRYGTLRQIERLLSVKTMEVRQTNVRSFVNWCELEYRGAVQAKYVNSGSRRFSPTRT